MPGALKTWYTALLGALSALFCTMHRIHSSNSCRFGARCARPTKHSIRMLPAAVLSSPVNTSNAADNETQKPAAIDAQHHVKGCDITHAMNTQPHAGPTASCRAMHQHKNNKCGYPEWSRCRPHHMLKHYTVHAKYQTTQAAGTSHLLEHALPKLLQGACASSHLCCAELIVIVLA
jgi:hypothetical protein